MDKKALGAWIKAEIKEMGSYTEADMISIMSLWKYLLIGDKDTIFVAQENSIIDRNKEILAKWGIKVQTVEMRLVNGNETN